MLRLRIGAVDGSPKRSRGRPATRQRALGGQFTSYARRIQAMT
jgi:hypothetical protein